ncbi:MAG: copper resistance CopC/CopD family protein [Deltaproteobacteria bacterium]
MRRGLARRLRRRSASSALALAVLLLAAAAAAAALPAAAAAHSALESSDPAADSSVPVSPRRIVLTFSEAPDAELSLIRVLDAQGAAVPGMSAPQVAPGASAALQVTPSEPLQNGVYTVNWRVVSSVDGHVESGAFAFGVGAQPAPDSAIVIELLHTSPWATGFLVVGRWLLYAALVVLVGAASTSLLVYGGKLPSGGVKVLWGALVTGLAALVAMIWSEKVLVGAPSLLPLFVMRQGLLLLGLGVALGLCLAAVVLVDLWPARWSLWLVGLAGAAAVFVHILAGHAASPTSLVALNVAVQWVHMTAIGVWVGGLFWLLLGFRGRDAAARRDAVGVFTRVATIVLVVVLATGLTRALVEVGSVSALLDTDYGITLLVKIALVVVLVGLGALNHFFWVPALREEGGAAGERRFGLNSRGELGVALAVLAATAALSGLAPARIADVVPGAGPATKVTASGSDYATSVRVELTLTPGVAGRNDYVLWADDYDTGDPLKTVTAVTLKCSRPDQPAAPAVTVQLAKAPDGSWTGSGLDFSVEGLWQVDVAVQEEAKGAVVPLELTVSPAPSP